MGGLLPGIEFGQIRTILESIALSFLQNVRKSVGHVGSQIAVDRMYTTPDLAGSTVMGNI